MKMLRVNNILLDPLKVTCAIQDRGDVNKVKVVFDNGFELVFEGSEAADVWKLLDEDKDWRDER